MARRTPTTRRVDREPIAIVGAGCRFPGGGNTPELFWQQLREGADVIREVPAERWDVDRHYDERPDTPGAMYARWGGFLKDVDRFDAAFFGIAPPEARQLDPQQRLLLQVAWEALEDAGLPADQLPGTRTSVFTSALGSDYQLLHTKQAGLAGIDPWYASGKEASFGAGRIAYLLGVNGVALSLSTACSSSLVATHLACQSLLSGESDVALVGGVNLLLSPELSMFMCKVGAMSPTGRCRVFDAAADGVVRGDGCAVLVLKRLTDALADRDDVLAVIRGSAVNHDGRSAGLTVPNGAAQQALIARALEVSGFQPSDIDYVETHGTGTPLGDPIEVESLAAALCRERQRPLVLGSLKANFGHMDAAAGVAGLLKAALVLRHGLVPPQLHLQQLNPNIRWDRWPLTVPTSLASLETQERPRTAGVSAFGLSGTNAHVVLEEAVLEEAPADRQPDGRPGVLAISARTGQALAELAEAHVRRLPGASGTSWDDYVNTSTARRQHHREHRVAIVAGDAGEAAARLRAVLESPLPTRTVIADGDPGPVFAFCGQGSQWLGMGLQLLREPAFALAFAQCEQAIGDEAGWSVRAALEDENLLSDTGLAQPTVFALQVSLAALWRNWGVEPGAVIGHSMGEIAAAYVAGVLSLSDASRIITHRGRLLRAARGLGLMAAVEQPEAELSARIARFGTALTISAVNSPAACVVSGEPPAVRELVDELRGDGIPARLMPGEYAFHTPRLAPFGQQLEELLSDLPAGQATIPILSTTPGYPGRFDAAHWGRNITEPVRFAGAVAELLARGFRSFLELGPHPVLGKPIAQCLDSAGASGVVISSLRRDNDAQLTCRSALASLYASGYPVNWDAVVSPEARAAKIPLYPWQNQRFWFDGAREDATDPVLAPPPATSQLSEPEGVPEAEHPPMPALELQRLITGLVAGLLGVAASDVRQETGFAELGMDSLLSVELRRQLSTAVGVTLPVTAVFDHPSVQRLAAHVGTQLAERTNAVDVSGAESASHADVADRSAEPIAVIGVGCRFPGGAHGPDRFWQLLTAGTDAITEAPPGRFAGSTIWRGGFLDGVDLFDARFFRIPPREAKVMDPQQRLFLETAWEALEHAGQAPDRLLGSKLSVFVGMNSTDYTQLVTATAGGVDAFFGTGNSFCAVPGRLSHLLGVHGPSLAVDTACSSSLVAIHLACQSLRRGESEMAVAGGVNVILQDTIFRASAASGALAADGRCKTFAASADGYARGEGCGVVVLKPLSAARADGDDVLAVILGSAVNQDGPSSGLTVPYGPAQQQLLRDALADAGVQAGEVGYVEAHGTGTRLGDPIELHALGTALAPAPGEVATRFLVGSVKTNIGHLEAAAGVAGFIKTVLALRHGVIPPHLHFDEPSPDIAWQDLPVDVPTAPTPWPADRPRRVAGVSAFGFSGTNAHLVLAGAPEPEAAPVAPSAASRKLLLLTAIADAPLRELAGAYADALEAGVPSVEDLCHTAVARRARHDHQLAVVGRDGAELAERLRAHLAGEDTESLTAGVVRAQRTSGPVFVFSGHGSQWRGMAADLLASEPAFAEAVARCDEALAEYLGWSVSECLRSGGGTESELDGQILVFAIQVALAALWRSFGVTPAAVVGHSMGEVAAAHVAGAISLQDAARLIFHRSRALQGLVGRGGMAVVGLPADQVESALAGYGDRLCVAVVNSGQSTVVSGEDSAIDELGAQMKRDNVFFRRVDAGGPGHSPLAEPLRQQLVDQLGRLRPEPGAVPFYSAVTGSRLAGEQLDEEYWGRNLRQPVRFADAVTALFADGYETFVELSPHPLLLVPIEQEARAAGIDPLVTATLVRGQDGPAAALTALARLQVGGQPVELSRVTPGRHAQAPTYPWQRQRYWVEPATKHARQESAHPLIARQLRAISGGSHYFEGSVSGELLGDPVSEDGVRIVPDGAWLDLVIAAAHERGGPGPVTLSQVRLAEPLVLDDGAEHTVQLAIPSDPAAGFEVRTAAVDGPARLRATGRLSGPAPKQPDGLPTPELDIQFDLPPATRRWLLRPELVEQCLRRSAQLVAEDAELWRAVAVQSVIWHQAPDDRVLLQAWRTGEHTVDIRVSTAAGELVFALLGVQLQRWHGRRLSATERGRIGRLRYQTAWREVSDPARDVARLAGRWLVLPDRGEVAPALAKALAEYGADCELLDTEALEGNGPSSEAIDGRDVRGVICLSALGAADDRAEEVYGEIAALARRVSPPVPVWYVTRGAVAPHPENSLVEPAQLPVWRLASVAAVERPASWGGLLDLKPQDQEPAADAVAIVAELAATDGEDRIAVRDGQRLAARLTRMLEPEPVRLPWQARTDRTYLLVGSNAGSDGATTKSLAQWLAARGATHVLTISAAELSEPGQLAGVAERLATAGAPIGGVVWAAVDWSLPEPTANPSVDIGPAGIVPVDIAVAARTRALGARLLHQQCPDLDLFVVFTGVASEWGAVGASGQAVPDGLLAGLVQERRAAGLTGCCIQWSAWDDPQLLDRDSRARLVRSGLEPLPPEAAIDVLDQIVADHVDEAQVAQADWGLIVPLYQQALAFPLFAELAGEDTAAADGAGLLDRLRTVSPERQHDELVELVLAELSVVLGLDEADETDPEQGFFALGVTSITGLEFRLRLERRVGIALPATLVFECPTVAAVVAFLQREALGGPAGSQPADNKPHNTVQNSNEAMDSGPTTAGQPEADDLLARLEDEIAATSALIARRTS